MRHRLLIFAVRKLMVDVGRYKNDPQIKAMTDLVDAYQRREVHSAEKILRGASVLLFHRFLPPRSAMDDLSTSI